MYARNDRCDRGSHKWHKIVVSKTNLFLFWAASVELPSVVTVAASAAVRSIPVAVAFSLAVVVVVVCWRVFVVNTIRIVKMRALVLAVALGWLGLCQ